MTPATMCVGEDLQADKASRDSCTASHLCRFVGVAEQWTAALLDQVDQERQGVDLFGKDALVLGHLLATLVGPSRERKRTV